MMSGGARRPPPDPVRVLSGKDAVTSIVFLDSDRLVTGHQNGQIQEWSIHIQRAVATWAGHTDTVLWLSSIHSKLVSQGRDGLVKAWDKDVNQPTQQSVIAQVPAASLIFCNSAVIDSASNSHLAVPSKETSHVNVHEIYAQVPNDQQSSISFSESPVNTLRPSPSKNYGMCMKMRPVIGSNRQGLLLIGYESGAVALWNVLEGNMLHSLRMHEDSVMCLTCWLNSPGEEIKGVSASVDNTIQVWRVSDDMISTVNSVSVINEGFNDIAVRKDRRIFVTGGWDGRGRVFGVKKLNPLAVLTYHKESITCVAFSPDNEVVTASKDGYIAFWDVFKNS